MSGFFANSPSRLAPNVGGQVCGPWNPDFLSPSKGGPNGTAIQKLTGQNSALRQPRVSIHTAFAKRE